MQMYPAYNQSNFEEDYSVKKDEFHFATKGCATEPMQGFEQNFDKVSHGYAGGQVHNFDKPMHGLSKDEFHYDNHSSSMNMMKASGSPTSPLHGFQQNFDKVGHGHAGSQAHGFDKPMHGLGKDEFHYDHSSSMNMMQGGRSPTPQMHGFQPNFDKVGHGHAGGQAHGFDKPMHGGFGGHNQNLDKFNHGGGYGGYEQNFDKPTHGYAGGYDKFNQVGPGGYNSQYQSSNFDKEGHHSTWNGGNDHYAHGGNGYNAHGGSGHYAQGGNMGAHQGYGNKYTAGMSQAHNVEMSAGYGGHQGSKFTAGMSQAHNVEMSAGYGGHQGPRMPMGGHRPHAGPKKGVATWNFKGIRD